MAARRNRRSNEEPQEDDLPELRPDEVDFLSFLEDIGPTGSIVEVYRIPRSGDAEWMDVLSFDIIKDGGQAYIRETYGPGKYKLVFKNSGKKFQGQKTLIIGGMPVAPAAAASAPVVNNDPRLQFLTEQMAQDRALMFKLIENMGKGAPTTDPAAMLTAVVTAFSVLKSASDPGGQSGNTMKQIKDTIELVASTKEMFGGSEPKEENMYTVVKELGQQFLGKVGPSAMSARTPGASVQTLHPGSNVPLRVTSMRPDAIPGDHTSIEPNPKDEVQQQQNAIQWIKAGLEYLKTKCKLGKPVELYMDLVWDHKEEPQFSALLQAITAGATFDNLLTFDEEIAQTPTLKTWFERLYNAIHEDIFNPVDTAGSGGHTDNAPENAGAGAEGSSER